jgi:hypothetical protein
MIEIIESLPDGVLGIVVKGRVTKQDCSDVLSPALEKALMWHHRLRLYYEIRSRYPGAAWEEISLGIEHGRLWERVAVVSDVAWIRHTVQALRLLIPGEIRVFTTGQAPEGLAWITGMPLHGRPRVPAFVVRPPGRNSAYAPPRQFLYHAP